MDGLVYNLRSTEVATGSKASFDGFDVVVLLDERLSLEKQN